MWWRDTGSWFQACGPATENALDHHTNMTPYLCLSCCVRCCAASEVRSWRLLPSLLSDVSRTGPQVDLRHNITQRTYRGTVWLTTTSAKHPTQSLSNLLQHLVIEFSGQCRRGRHIFNWILTLKLRGSAYTQLMPHSHTLTARVSMAYCCCGGCIPVTCSVVTVSKFATTVVFGSDLVVLMKSL